MTLSELTYTYTHPTVDSREKFVSLVEKYLESEGHEKLTEDIYSSMYDLNYDEIGKEHAYIFAEEIYRFFDGEKTESSIEYALKKSNFYHTEYVTFKSDDSFLYHCGNIKVEVFGHEFRVLVCDEFYSTDSAMHQLELLGFVHDKPIVSKLELAS